jgi:hypothetical protein
MAERNDIWLSYYDDIVSYLQSSDGIILTADALSFTDQEQKVGFHSRLDAMTRAVAEDSLAAMRDQADEEQIVLAQSAKNFRLLASSLCSRCELSEIRLPAPMQGCLSDEPQVCKNLLFWPSLGLLRGNIAADAYLSATRESIAVLISDIRRSLYEAWAYYGIIDALAPVRFWDVLPSEPGAPSAPGAPGAPGAPSAHDGLTIVPASCLRLGYQPPLVDYRLPEAVFVTQDGSCFAYKIEHSAELESYKRPCGKLDFTKDGDTSAMVCRRVLLLYRLKSPTDVVPLAVRSKKHMLAPELMVEHLSASELLDERKRQAVCHRAELTGCIRPTQVVLASEQTATSLTSGHATEATADKPALELTASGQAPEITPELTASGQAPDVFGSSMGCGNEYSRFQTSLVGSERERLKPIAKQAMLSAKN